MAGLRAMGDSWRAIRREDAVFWGLALAATTGWLLFHFAAVLGCLSECYVDLEVLHGDQLGRFESVDTHLNSWILAWVSRALVTPGVSLFDTNVFHPALGTLTGSEHMLGLALWILPLRLFETDAVWTHQVATIATYGVLSLTTMGLVRSLTGSSAVAIASGIVAMAMPWRSAELTHLQVLTCHWFPLIWLLTLRALLGMSRSSEALLLFAVLVLQLLSSYYLAYLLTFSLAILAGLVVALRGLGARAFGRLALVALSAYTVMLAVSQPYLSRRSSGHLEPVPTAELVPLSDRLLELLGELLPRNELLAQPDLPDGARMYVPLAIALLALFSLPWLGGLRRREAASRRGRRALMTGALWLCVLGAFLLWIGPEVEIHGKVTRLPASWAAAWIPGFANLRAEHRWGILIWLAMPILAGLGASWLRERTPPTPLWRGATWRHATLVALGAFVFLGIPWRQLPTRPAWVGPAGDDGLYAALAELPPGPLLEIPWYLDPMRSVLPDTLYMLASTRHWRPLMNGFTAYLPPGYHLLQRLTQRLPDPDAVNRLARLTALRWIVVHNGDLPPHFLRRWREVGDEAGLREVFRNDEGAIFELPPGEDTGRWLDAFRDTRPRERTLAGLSRARLAGADARGAISSVDPPSHFSFFGNRPRPKALPMEITNRGIRQWPGLDPQRQGLVQLRYAFARMDGQFVAEDLAPLDTDIEPGTTRVAPFVLSPTRTGRYRMCLGLAQEIDGVLHPLEVSPVALEISVQGQFEDPSSVGTATRRLDPSDDLARCLARAKRRTSARSGSDSSPASGPADRDLARAAIARQNDTLAQGRRGHEVQKHWTAPAPHPGGPR